MPALLFALLLSLAPAATASSTTQPHEHHGVAPKFTVPTRTSDLSDEELEALLAGQSIRRQVKYDSGGRGISIMDVHGTPEQVWAVIDDFGSYPEWVDMLEETEVYGRDGTEVLVRFKLRIMGKEVEYFIDHERRVDQGYVTWQLDYSRLSDIDDSTGYWLVYDAPGRPGYTRVEYTVDLRLKGWIPGFVEDMLANKGLEKATGWVKKQVEG